MSEYVFKLPDLGEGTVEAEIVEWHVKPGDVVKEGDIVCDVMTDKANVEVPAPVDGKVLRTSGEPGDIVAVGAELIALEAAVKAAGKGVGRGAGSGSGKRSEKTADKTANETVDETVGKTVTKKGGDAGDRGERSTPENIRSADTASAKDTVAQPEAEPVRDAQDEQPAQAPAGAPAVADTPAAARDRDDDRGPVITSPAIRRRAKEAGVDLHDVPGSGPRGRILRRDLEAFLEGAPVPRTAPASAAAREPDGEEFTEAKVIGVRRVIAERMSQSKREIPHFAYVEEVDVSELERLRRHLNDTHERRLSVLPFIAAALIRALAEFPQCNARYDAERNMLQTFRPVHLGIATQTADGLKVPVVRDAQRLDLWRLASEIARVAEAAREGKAGRQELSGSTITITSLGRMGGIVTTPVINYPEVGIIGVNKAVDRPMVVDGQVRIRTMMNLSSSFDHRFVDGFDAAAMIQRIRTLLEHPATLFLGDPG
ncbi:MAG: dihydrolipoamide acetyltransferase family protein [Pseudomonadales bacterium]